MTGCPLARACLLACRLGDESQQSVAPQLWHVRRCTHREPVFTHSSHSCCFACFTVLMLSIWVQAPSMDFLLDAALNGPRYTLVATGSGTTIIAAPIQRDSSHQASHRLRRSSA